MDGPITFKKYDAANNLSVISGTIVIRAAAQKTCAKDADNKYTTETCQITGYEPYWDVEYSARIVDE